MSYRVMKEFTTPQHRFRVGAVIEAGDIDGRMTAEQMLKIGVLQDMGPPRIVPKMTVDIKPAEDVEQDAGEEPAKDKPKK